MKEFQNDNWMIKIKRRGAYKVKVLKHREAFPPFTNAHAFDVSDKLIEGDYEKFAVYS